MLCVPDPDMFGLELALLTRLTPGLSGQGGSRSDSGSGWSMLVVSVLIKDLVKISTCECRSTDCHNSVGEVCRLSDWLLVTSRTAYSVITYRLSSGEREVVIRPE